MKAKKGQLCGVAQWYFLSKIALNFCEKKKCSRDREKLLNFKAEGQVEIQTHAKYKHIFEMRKIKWN